MLRTDEIDRSAMMLKMRMTMLMIELDCEMNREAEGCPFDPSLVSNFCLLLNDSMPFLGDLRRQLFEVVRKPGQSFPVHLWGRGEEKIN